MPHCEYLTEFSKPQTSSTGAARVARSLAKNLTALTIGNLPLRLKLYFFLQGGYSWLLRGVLELKSSLDFMAKQSGNGHATKEASPWRITR